MATPDALPKPASAGAHPALIVAGNLLAVVALSFLISTVGDYDSRDAFGSGTANLAGPAPVGACGQGTPADSNYSVDLVANPDPPRPEGTTFLFSVRHGGRAITGAKVCLSADMPDMPHPGINYVAKEGPGGRYEARLQFGMGGSWRTSVTVAEPDKPVVSVPLTIQVAQVDPN
jgi:hypothetical protein